TLNRPDQMNALNSEISGALAEALMDFRDDDNARVAILSGMGGRAFSAGMDLKETARTNQTGEKMVPIPDVTSFNIWKPIIAAIDGYCLAGGLEVALECDIRIATKQSAFGLPEVRRGIMPGYGLHNLSRVVPLGEALYVQLTGGRLSAERAYQIGLIQELVETREELFSAAERIARDVLLCAPLSVQATKRIVYQARGLPAEYSWRLGEPLVERVIRSEDAVEGPRAFAEKRDPQWKMR
ncbi:MAG: enoyl-CoA hydratase/isomerase family protein, partial [Chloroflexi bacterium]|nr:enoyl-CoA hydratase/isomerase family protein [Chloroflexota bacterium]